MILSEALGFVAGAIGISSSLPQVLRIIKLRSSQGISLTTQLLMYGYSSVWLGYGISTASPSQIITNGLATLFSLIILVLMLAKTPRNYLMLATLPLVVIFVALNVPTIVLAPILLFSAATALTQVIKSYKSRKADTHSAVSIHMLVMSEIASVLWLGYAIIGHRAIVEVTSIISIILTATILGLEANEGKRISTA